MLWINISLLVTGTTATLAAFGGETWQKGDSPILTRITRRGWLSLGLLVLAFCLGVTKEVRAKRLSDEAADVNQRLAAANTGQLTQIAQLQTDLSRSVSTFMTELRKQPEIRATAELIDAIRALKPEELAEVLRLPRTGEQKLAITDHWQGRLIYGVLDDNRLATLANLQDKGFAQEHYSIHRFDSLTRNQLQRLPSMRARLDADRTWYYAKAPSDSPIDNDIRRQGYHLTEFGGKAVDALIRTVSNQLPR